jgi:TrmH family RNA methyltransferase
MTRLSAGHARVKRLRKLCRRRSVRRDEGLFVLHGPTLVAEALSSEVVLDEVFLSEPPDFALQTLLDTSAVEVFEVDPSVLQKAVDVVTPQSVVATARLPADSLDRVLAPAEGLVLGLMGVSDPGNVGTLMRTAEAAGVRGVLIGPETADPFGPKTVRASAGSVLRVPVASVESGEVEELGALGWSVVATVGDGGDPLDAHEWATATVMLLGNEAAGLDPETVARADAAVTIEHEPSVESLNVSTAGALAMFDWRRRARPTT